MRRHVNPHEVIHEPMAINHSRKGCVLANIRSLQREPQPLVDAQEALERHARQEEVHTSTGLGCLQHRSSEGRREDRGPHPGAPHQVSFSQSLLNNSTACNVVISVLQLCNTDDCGGVGCSSSSSSAIVNNLMALRAFACFCLSLPLPLPEITISVLVVGAAPGDCGANQKGILRPP